MEPQPEIVLSASSPFWPVLAVAVGMWLYWRHRRSSGRPAPGISCQASTPTVQDMGLTSLDLHTSADNADIFPLRYCPVCNSAFLPDTEVCDECGVELQNEPADPLPTQALERDSTVHVARILDPIRCNLVVGLLRNEGIPCSVARASVLGNLGGDIYVFLGDAFHAKRLIQEYLDELEKTP